MKEQDKGGYGTQYRKKEGQNREAENKGAENKGVQSRNGQDSADQEILTRLEESAKNIAVPEALKPEAVKARLDMRLEAENLKGVKKQKNRRKTGKRFYRNLAAAACLCICVGGTAVSYFYNYEGAKNTIGSQPEQQAPNGSKEDGPEAGFADGDQNHNTKGQSVTDGPAVKVQKESSAGEPREKKVKKLGKTYRLASGYGDVYDVLKKAEYELTTGMRKEAAGSAEMEDSMNVKNVFAAEKDTAASGDFSTTNLQVEGVDESDAVKTDGKYVYVVQEEKIRILDAQGKALELAATIKPDIEESLESICEIYVADNVLTAVLQADRTELKNGEDDGEGGADTGGVQKQALKESVCYDTLYMDYDAVTKVLTYDISDPVHPAPLDTMEQDGFYQSSRKIGNYLYLFTNKQMHLQNTGTKEELTDESRAAGWIPKVNSKAVSPDCIYLPKEGNQGVVMSCMDLAANCAVLDTKMLVSHGAQLYVTADSAYFYSSDYTGNSEKTRIARFALDTDGKIRAKAAVSLKGGITDTFAISQSGGYLRVLTSLTDKDPWENRVYVVDTQDMKIAGSLTGIAPGEMIYAARFVGKTGYFVTYRNTDPLFTVDFSNPEKPKLIGELSVTGFSEYLHFWSDKKLLGIGYETNQADGSIIGVKLSMYDISNPKKVTEQAKTVLQGVDDSEAMYDYKSVLIDRRKNLIAFTTQTYEERCHDVYHVYSYKGGAFTGMLERPIGSKGCGDNTRSLYIGDKLYLVGSRKALTFLTSDNFKEAGKLTY